MTDNQNPGNFANRSKDEVQNIASKGGQTGSENAGFASMAKDKVVSSVPPLILDKQVSDQTNIARHRLSGWPSQ